MSDIDAIEMEIVSYLKASEDPVSIQQMVTDLTLKLPDVRSYQVKQSALSLVSRGMADITADWKITETATAG